MGDHVVVVEACGSPTVSESVLRTVGEQLPGKPVRSVVLTHHHSDHSGGLWTYMARGITVLTTPGNVDFVRSIAAAPASWTAGWPTHPSPASIRSHAAARWGAGPTRSS